MVSARRVPSLRHFDTSVRAVATRRADTSGHDSSIRRVASRVSDTSNPRVEMSLQHVRHVSSRRQKVRRGPTVVRHNHPTPQSSDSFRRRATRPITFENGFGLCLGRSARCRRRCARCRCKPTRAVTLCASWAKGHEAMRACTQSVRSPNPLAAAELATAR